jgi:O-antigen/teichoic acid export membrane protein
MNQGWSVNNLLLGMLLISLCRVVIGCLIIDRLFFKIRTAIDFKFLKKIFFVSYPFALMGIIGTIYFRVNIVILSLMQNDATVGWYSASFNIISMLMFISYGFSMAIYPVLSRYYQSSTNSFYEVTEKSCNYLFVIGLPIAVGITLLGDKIIYLVYGAQFERSIIALKILIWSIPLIYVTSPLLRMFYASNKQKTALVLMCISMLFNIILNLLLIPKLSYIGSSLVTVLSELFNFVLFYLAINKIFSHKIKMNKLAARSIGAVALMGLMILVLKDLNVFIIIGLAIIVYFVLLYILKSFSEYDIDILKGLYRKALRP